MIYVYGDPSAGYLIPFGSASFLLVERDLHDSASWLDHKGLHHCRILIFHAVCNSSGGGGAEEPWIVRTI
jgi:hypothetical protein